MKTTLFAGLMLLLAALTSHADAATITCDVSLYKVSLPDGGTTDLLQFSDTFELLNGETKTMIKYVSLEYRVKYNVGYTDRFGLHTTSLLVKGSDDVKAIGIETWLENRDEATVSNEQYFVSTEFASTMLKYQITGDFTEAVLTGSLDPETPMSGTIRCLLNSKDGAVK